MTDSPEKMLVEVQDDGLRVYLEDGSQWKVNPIDSKAVLKWAPTAMIRIKRVSEDSKFPYELINIPEGKLAHAAEVE